MSDMNGIDRRAFCLQLGAAAAMIAAGDLWAAQGTPAPVRIPTRPIPRSGEALPVVGFGSTEAVMDIPQQGAGPLSKALDTMLGLGARVVDTSPRSEEIDRVFGQALQQPGRERLFVAAKVNTMGAANGVAQFRQTQRLFGRHTLDLVQVESLRDVDAHWPNLRAWKDAGEARYIGVTVSNEGAHERMAAFLRKETPDFMHVNYSVVETAAENRLLPLARERGLAVLINRPFMNGEYFPRVAQHKLPEWAADFDCTSWAQFSLKYILGHPAVTCALTETISPAHMEENIRAALGRLPDDATRRRMRELVGQFA